MAINYSSYVDDEMRDIDKKLSDTLKRIDSSTTTMYKLGTTIEKFVKDRQDTTSTLKLGEELGLIYEPKQGLLADEGKEGLLTHGEGTFWGYHEGVPFQLSVDDLKTLDQFKFQIPDADIKQWVSNYGARDSRFAVGSEDIFADDSVFSKEQVYEMMEAYKAKHASGDLSNESDYASLMLEDKIITADPPTQGPITEGAADLGDFDNIDELDSYLENVTAEELDSSNALPSIPVTDPSASLNLLDDYHNQSNADWEKFQSVWDLGSAGRYGDKFIAMINGKPAHVNETEFYMIQRFGDDAANYIHRKKIEEDGKVTLNPTTGLPEYYDGSNVQRYDSSGTQNLANMTTSLGAFSAYGSSAAGGAALTSAFGASAGGTMASMATAMAPFMAVAGPVMLGVAWVAGANAKAKAMKAKRAAAKRGIKMLRNAQGDQAQRIDEGLAHMTKGLQSQLGSARTKFSGDLDSVSAEQEKSIRATKGLYTSSATDRTEEALDNLSATAQMKEDDMFVKFEQDQWTFLQREREQMKKLGLDLDKMYRQLRSTRGKTSTIDNLI